VSGRITTHVLDTARGVPAAGIHVVLRRDGEVVATAVTDADGRTGAPLHEGLEAGTYEITFSVGGYLAGEGFLDEVPVRFRVDDPAAHHHVPLLLSPWSYTTYRGS